MDMHPVMGKDNSFSSGGMRLGMLFHLPQADTAAVKFQGAGVTSGEKVSPGLDSITSFRSIQAVCQSQPSLDDHLPIKHHSSACDLLRNA